MTGSQAGPVPAVVDFDLLDALDLYSVELLSGLDVDDLPKQENEMVAESGFHNQQCKSGFRLEGLPWPNRLSPRT